MRLCVDGPGHTVYIAAYAATRCELAQKLSDQISIKIGDVWQDYNINDVYAEPASRLDIAFMMIGALIGLLGGVFGIMIGSLFGYLCGRNEDAKEERRVKIFNGCHIGGTYDAPNK